MKIGLLTTSFPRTAQDVPGSFVRGFASALAARGHRIEVLAPEPHEAQYESPPQLEGVTVSWVPYLRPRSLQRTFYGAGVLDNLRTAPLAAVGVAPFVLALAAATRSQMPHWDAVVSHWAVPCALVAGALRERQQRHLAVFHSADVFLLERLPAPLRRLLATRIAHTADALLFSSQDLRRRFLAVLGPLTRAELAACAHVCPMGIEPAAQTPLASRAALRERYGLTRFSVLSLGRLIPLKGIAHAITAVADMPDSELLVCGEGPEQAALARQAAHTGARVRFMGSVFGAEKAALLRAADAFVLPSIKLPSGRTEGMPQVLLEAMEQGLPVVASDVGGVSDVVRNGDNGMLVSPADPPALARALSALRDAATHRRLSAGARTTARLYHWSTLAPLLESLLVGEPPEP